MGYPSDGNNNPPSPDPDRPDETEAPENIMRGLQLIGEMSTEDMIEEVIADQRGALATMPPEEIKKILISLRVNQYRKRLIGEADFSPPNPFGFLFGNHDGCNHD